MIDIFKQINIYLEFIDEKHHKFYELSLDKNLLKINYGRIGRKGKLKLIYFQEYEQGYKLFQNQFTKKLKKGYKKAIKGLTLPRIKGVHPNQLSLFSI
ncbi:MAG: WGR domain-containing protein [Candidatus Sericytochromatia bacterium]